MKSLYSISTSFHLNDGFDTIIYQQKSVTLFDEKGGSPDRKGDTEPYKVPNNAGDRAKDHGGSTGNGKPEGKKPSELPPTNHPTTPISAN